MPRMPSAESLRCCPCLHPDSPKSLDGVAAGSLGSVKRPRRGSISVNLEGCGGPWPLTGMGKSDPGGWELPRKTQGGDMPLTAAAWSLGVVLALSHTAPLIPRAEGLEAGPDPPWKAPPAPGRLPNGGRSVSKSGWHQGQRGQAKRRGVSQRAGVQSLPRGCDAAMGSGWQRGGEELAWTLPTAGISGRTWSFLPDSLLSFIEIGLEEPEWAERRVGQRAECPAGGRKARRGVRGFVHTAERPSWSQE